MGLTRRHFLQQVGLGLAAWSASEIGLWTLSDRYRQVLATPTSRKLALLVGINQYPLSSVLEGCVTDVELQKELLIHRFGFSAADIVTLTDGQATRDGIERAFVNHLVQQAKPDDVVVFHFSGFGSTVTNARSQPDPSSVAEPHHPILRSLVMADALPTTDVPVVNDLLEETLWLLLRSLKTENVTAILDTSFAYPGKALQGNLRIRSYPNPSNAQPSEAELAFQEELRQELHLGRDRRYATKPIEPSGVVLTATQADQVATEARWNRFSAGLFTAALTQALWQETPATTIWSVFKRISQNIDQVVSEQEPQVSGLKSQSSTLSPYFLPLPTMSVDGAIVGVDEVAKTVQVWLGGLSIPVLEHYGVNSLLTVLPDQSQTEDASSLMQLQILSREGFTVKAKVCCSSTTDTTDLFPPFQIGQLVQETVRVLPRNVGLTIALDGSLERIERVDAISALTSVPRVSSAIAGEQSADYLFSKVENPQTQLASLPSVPLNGLLSSASTPTGYGLFSPGHNIILNTTGEGGEAVKVAIRRLVPKFQALLATKLLNLTINDQTSRLKLRVSLNMIAPQEQRLAQQATWRGGTFPSLPFKTQPPQTKQIPEIAIGSRVCFQVETDNSMPLYCLAITLDSASNLLWLTVPTLSETQPGETVNSNPANLIPSQLADWQVQGPLGSVETYLIFSQSPFKQTLALLINQQRSGSTAIVGTAMTNPLEIAQTILQDLHESSSLAAPVATPDSYALDVNTWATLRFIYQVI